MDHDVLVIKGMLPDPADLECRPPVTVVVEAENLGRCCDCDWPIPLGVRRCGPCAALKYGV